MCFFSMVRVSMQWTSGNSHHCMKLHQKIELMYVLCLWLMVQTQHCLIAILRVHWM
jgi:hypothetical protein